MRFSGPTESDHIVITITNTMSPMHEQFCQRRQRLEENSPDKTRPVKRELAQRTYVNISNLAKIKMMVTIFQI